MAHSNIYVYSMKASPIAKPKSMGLIYTLPVGRLCSHITNGVDIYFYCMVRGRVENNNDERNGLIDAVKLS